MRITSWLADQLFLPGFLDPDFHCFFLAPRSSRKISCHLNHQWSKNTSQKGSHAILIVLVHVSNVFEYMVDNNNLTSNCKSQLYVLYDCCDANALALVHLIIDEPVTTYRGMRKKNSQTTTWPRLAHKHKQHQTAPPSTLGMQQKTPPKNVESPFPIHISFSFNQAQRSGGPMFFGSFWQFPLSIRSIHHAPPALVSVIANPSAIFNSSIATTNRGAKFETTATSAHLGTCHVHTSGWFLWYV